MTCEEIICENLQSNDRQTILKALKELDAKFTAPDAKSDALLEIFNDYYLYLLKCYSNRFESVRLQTAELLTKFIAQIPPNDFYLLNIVSVLAQRMAKAETVEESEEMRLIFIKQLHQIVQRYEEFRVSMSLMEAMQDIMNILIKSLRDSYPAVQRESCFTVTTLFRNLKEFTLSPYTKKVVIPLYGILNHKHSNLRIACVQALSYVALHVVGDTDDLSKQLMEISPLLMDAMPLVRRECGEMGVLLALELRDRYSYFERILPLVLCCLKDEAPDVVNYITPLWIKCGKQYYNENEEELSKLEIGDVGIPNYPADAKRPTIGCRALVQRALRMLSLIMRESGDWKDNVRLHSFKLLYQFVLHAEAAMTSKFFEIYNDLAKGCKDQEADVAKEAFKVANLMGVVLSYEDWRDHGINGLEAHPNEGHLKCFYYMYNATSINCADDITRIAKILLTPEFSQSLKSEMQKYVLKLIQTLFKKSDNIECENLEEILFATTAKIMALSLSINATDDCNIQALGEEILSNIAERKQCATGQLYEEYFAKALDYVQNLDVALDAQSEPIHLLYGLIVIGQFREPYMPMLEEKCEQALNNCADEAKLKIFSAISISLLKWEQTINREVHVSAGLLTKFVSKIIEPHLLWKAGANAEALRCLATASICAISEGAAQNVAEQIYPMILKYLPSLLEDHATSTRIYAVKAIKNFGELPVEQLRNIAYLQRVDDPCAAIREHAVKALAKLRPKYTADEQEHDKATWLIFIKKTFDMLFLHYEGPELKLQSAIKATLLELTQLHPELAKISFETNLAMSHATTALQELQLEMHFDA